MGWVRERGECVLALRSSWSRATLQEHGRFMPWVPLASTPLPGFPARVSPQSEIEARSMPAGRVSQDHLPFT